MSKSSADGPGEEDKLSDFIPDSMDISRQVSEKSTEGESEVGGTEEEEEIISDSDEEHADEEKRKSKAAARKEQAAENREKQGGALIRSGGQWV